MDDTLHFDGRDVKPFAEFALGCSLVEGETYFAVHFVDDDMLIPELRPLVYLGRDREPGDMGQLYFQDAASYVAGVRYEAATGDRDAEFHVVEEHTPLVLEYERALDMLLRCSLERRRKHGERPTAV
jgi:hypothetical protein